MVDFHNLMMNGRQVQDLVRTGFLFSQERWNNRSFCGRPGHWVSVSQE